MAFAGVEDVVPVPGARFVLEVVLRTQFCGPTGWSPLGSQHLAVDRGKTCARQFREV